MVHVLVDATSNLNMRNWRAVESNAKWVPLSRSCLGLQQYLASNLEPTFSKALTDPMVIICSTLKVQLFFRELDLKDQNASAAEAPPFL
jgi:hypothetical protein